MAKHKDISGQKYGMLTAVRYVCSFSGNAKWLFVCDCGQKTLALANNVRRGLTVSCGCFRHGRLSQPRTHGNSHRGRFTAEYRAYRGAKHRCTNPSFTKWSRYGGRGIKFKFASFIEFLAAVGPKPAGTELDRIDNEGHYESGNVRWVSHQENCQNRGYGNN